MYRLAAAMSAACLLVPSFTSPASASASLALDATFGSSRVEQSCSRTGCTISSTSLTCAAYGVRGTVPYVEGCVAEISLAVDRFIDIVHVAPDARVGCLMGVGSVSVTTTSGTTVSIPVVSLPGPGVVPWQGMPTVPSMDPVTLGDASGTLGVTCHPAETAVGEFTGTLKYASV